MSEEKSMQAASTSTAMKSPGKVLAGYAADIVAPFLAYLLVHWFGAGAVWALTAGGLAAGATTLVNTIRRRRLDAIGTLVLLELAASVVMLVTLRDSRLMLVRPSFYTGIAAVYLVFSVLRGHPLSVDGAKPMAAKDGAKRLAAYERAWKESEEFRRTHAIVTLLFAAALLADSLLRVLIVYRYPLEKSAWLSNVPHLAAIALIVAASALAGRRFSRMVDEQMEAATTPGENRR